MMINEPGKIMIRLPKGHIWTTENIRLPNLATFLVQLRQLLLVLYLQLGQLLQLSVVPRAVMAWAAIGQTRTTDVPNQNPLVSVSLPRSRHCFLWMLCTPGTRVICNKPRHSSTPGTLHQPKGHHTGLGS